jgi:hypothetical protein
VCVTLRLAYTRDRQVTCLQSGNAVKEGEGERQKKANEN